MTSAVPVAVSAGLDHPGAHPFNHVSVHHPELAYPRPTDTDDLTTTAPSALHHDHDQLTTTATTAHSTATNHDHNPFRHWHPAVPFPGAAVTGTAEAAKAAPC